MVVDIGEVKHHIKPKADSTLRNMRKDDLIEYIRCLENNYNVAVSFNENQAKYIESLDAVEVVHGRWLTLEEFAEKIGADATGYSGGWVYCSECDQPMREINGWLYCPNCGAKMDGERKVND